MVNQREELLRLQRENRRELIAHLDDYRRIARHGPDASARDAALVRAALSMLIGDVLAAGSDDLYINAGN